MLRHERKQRRAALVGANKVLEYSGRNHGGAAAAHSGKMRFGVGVLLPAATPGAAPHLRIWETDLVFSVQQRVTSATAAATQEAATSSSAAGSASDAMDNATRRALVVDTFGSKRAKLDKRKREDNSRAAETIAAASQLLQAVHMEAAIEETSGAIAAAAVTKAAPGGLTDAEKAEEASRRRVLPRYNRAASTPELAYPFEGLLDADSLKTLGKPVNILLKLLRKTRGKAVEDGGKSAVAGLDKALDAGHLPLTSLGNFARQRFVALAQEADAGDAAVSRRPLEALLVASLLIAVHSSGRTLRPAKPAADAKPAAETEAQPGTAAEASSSSSSSAAAAAAATAGVGADAAKNAAAALFPTRPVPQCLALAAPELSDAVLRKFTERQSAGRGKVTWTRQPQFQDRLMMHIAVAALWAARFDLSSVLTLARDLGLPPRKLVLTYFRQLGCKHAAAASAPPSDIVAATPSDAAAFAAASGEGDYRVTLPAPLLFPPPKRKRASKR